MVDETLPLVRPDERPLRVLFLELNSYFASCKQQEDTSLRGKPIIVVTRGGRVDRFTEAVG